MKMISLKSATLALLVTVLGCQVYAQPGQGRQQSRKGEPRHECHMQRDSMVPGEQCGIPGLTPEQEKSIKKSKLAFQKEATALKNQLAEKKAHLRTLNTAEKPDNAAIDKTIDEIAALKAQLMKNRNSHYQEVRAVLTDEQKIFFDSKGGKHKGRKAGCGGSGPHGAR